MAANWFALAAATELPQPDNPPAPGCTDSQTAPQRGRDRDSNPHERRARQQNSVRLPPVLALLHLLRNTQTLRRPSFAAASHTSRPLGLEPAQQLTPASIIWASSSRGRALLAECPPSVLWRQGARLRRPHRPAVLPRAEQPARQPQPEQHQTGSPQRERPAQH